MKHRLLAAGLLLAGLNLPLLAQQGHPNVATGTRSESLYVDSGSDQVNLFNGNLSYTIPIGEPIPVGPVLRIAPKLSYNSQLWKTWQYYCNSSPYYEEPNFLEAATGDRAFGAGWQLHFGRLVAPPSGFSYQLPGRCPTVAAPVPREAASFTSDPPAPGMWPTGLAYLSPEGSVHVFYDRQLESETPLTGTPRTGADWPCRKAQNRTPGQHCFGYTHDGSFLRVDPIDPDHGGAPVVYFPDGTKRVLEFAGGRTVRELDSRFSGSSADTYFPFSGEPVARTLEDGSVEAGPWNTTAILDPWGNSITVRYYGQPCSATPCAPAHPLSTEPVDRRDAIVWRVWDTASSTRRYVLFTATVQNAFLVPQPVVSSISTLSSATSASGIPLRATWQLGMETSARGFLRLSTLTLPLGQVLQASYDEDDPRSRDLLRSMSIPTGGDFEWDYGQISFFQKQSQECPGGCQFTFGHTTGIGVVARRAIRRIVPFGAPATDEVAETRYVRSYDSESGGPYFPCSVASLPDCQMRVDVWSPPGNAAVRTVTRSRFHESDGVFKGALYGRPMWTKDYSVDSGRIPDRDALLGEVPFRTTDFSYDWDGGSAGGEPYAPGFEHETRTAVTTTSWTDGRSSQESHLLPGGLSSWDRFTGHWGRTEASEWGGGSPSVVHRVVVESWLLAPPGASGAWNLGLLSTRSTSRPRVEGSADPSAEKLLTNESFTYDATGFLTRSRITSDDPGDTRVLSRTFTRGAQASAPCLKNGSSSSACSNLGFPVAQTDSLVGSLNGVSVSSAFARSFYYRFGSLAAAHGSSGFYTVDLDVIETGKAVGARGPEGRTSLTDAYPQLTTVTKYDLLGRVVSVQPPGEGPEVVTYDLQSVLREKKDLAGAVVSRRQAFFDQLGRLSAVRVAMPGGVWSCQVTTLDAAGRLVGQTEWRKSGDPEAGTLCDAPLDVQASLGTGAFPASSPPGTTWSGFDALGRATETRLADGSQVADSYQGWWQQDTTRQVGSVNSGTSFLRDSVRTVLRDSLGRVVGVTEPATAKANGSAMNRADSTSYVYDHQDRLLRVSKLGSDANAGALGEQLRTSSWDDFGWLLARTDPESGTYGVPSRNAQGSPLREQYPDRLLTHSFDAAGRLSASTDASDATSPFLQLFYDAVPAFTGYAGSVGRANGRLVYSIRNNHTKTTHYSPSSPYQQVDFGWIATQDLYHYTGLGGRLGFRQMQTLEISGDPATPSFVALSAEKKPKSLKDSLHDYFVRSNRVLNANDRSLTKAPPADPKLTLAGATLGSASSPSGWLRWAYEYDTAGRLSRTTYPRRDEGSATQVTYAYDSGYVGSVTVDFRDPFSPGANVETSVATLAYNSSGSVLSASVSSSASSSVFRLTTPGDVSGMSRPGRWTLSRGTGQVSVADHPYAYDPSGNITEAGPASYGYDTRGRLVYDSLPSRPADPSTRAYDGFGNLASVTDGASTTSLSTDISTNRLVGPGAMEYDSAGRLLYDGGRMLQRDYYPDGVLMAEFQHAGDHMVFPSGISGWLLDGRGERAMSFWGQDGVDTQLFLHTPRDEQGRVLTEYRVENDPACSAAPCDRFQKDYVWIGNRALLTWTRGTGSRFAALDHLGTPTYTFDRYGNQVSQLLLDPFGRDDGSSPTADRHRFTGHERDHVTSLDGPSLPIADHMHARTYVPMLGRFTRPDPANSFSLFNPQSLNRYAYVGNNPVNFIDPYGLETVCASGECTADTTVTADDPGDDEEEEKARRQQGFLLRMMTSAPARTVAHAADTAGFFVTAPFMQFLSGAVRDDTEDVLIGLGGHLTMAVGFGAGLIAVEGAGAIPALYHYTNAAGAAGIRSSGGLLVPGLAAGGRVWATSARPDQVFGRLGAWYQLKMGAGLNFRFGGPFGIQYAGRTQFTRYFSVADQTSFIRPPVKGFLGQYYAVGPTRVGP